MLDLDPKTKKCENFAISRPPAPVVLQKQPQNPVFSGVSPVVLQKQPQNPVGPIGRESTLEYSTPAPDSISGRSTAATTDCRGSDVPHQVRP
jgi:hypothetical protein